MNFNRQTIFISGLVVFLIVIVAGAIFSARYFAPAETEKKNTPSGNTPPNTNAITSEYNDPRQIKYTDGGFSVSALAIKSSDAIGCLLTIKNESTKPLKVGISPHKTPTDPGVDYHPIEPGGVGIIDVRYPGFSEIKLHNHANAAQEVKVTCYHESERREATWMRLQKRLSMNDFASAIE
jgi:hypothetical protein